MGSRCGATSVPGWRAEQVAPEGYVLAGDIDVSWMTKPANRPTRSVATTSAPKDRPLAHSGCGFEHLFHDFHLGSVSRCEHRFDPDAGDPQLLGRGSTRSFKARTCLSAVGLNSSRYRALTALPCSMRTWLRLLPGWVGLLAELVPVSIDCFAPSIKPRITASRSSGPPSAGGPAYSSIPFTLHPSQPPTDHDSPRGQCSQRN